MTLSTRVDSQLNKLAIKSAAKVGLEVADLVRNGLHTVCREITTTGALRVSPSPARLARIKRKGAVAK